MSIPETGLQPASGVFENGAFTFPVRVYYEDTDSFGIVYYANYLKFAERARTEMLRVFGTSNARLREESGVVFAVRRCIIDFRSPARLEDALTIVTRVIRVAGASFVLSQKIYRDAGLLVDVEVVLACLTGAGRPARVPAALKTALAKNVIDNER